MMTGNNTALGSDKLEDLGPNPIDALRIQLRNRAQPNEARFTLNENMTSGDIIDLCAEANELAANARLNELVLGELSGRYQNLFQKYQDAMKLLNKAKRDQQNQSNSGLPVGVANLRSEPPRMSQSIGEMKAQLVEIKATIAKAQAQG